MKRIVSLLLAVFLGVLLGGCTQAPKEPDRLFLIKERGKYGYIDRTGRVVIPPQFVDAGNFSEGLAGVQLSKEGHKHGYIDTSGKMVIPPQFEECRGIFPKVWLVVLLGRRIRRHFWLGFHRPDRQDYCASRGCTTWKFIRWFGPSASSTN